MARISRLAAVSFAACAAAYTAPRSPAPRLGPQCAERPVGGLEAASDADYETWISGQLRLNRVQDKVVGIEERVVGALRRADAAASLGAIGRDIDVLGAWEELLPLRRLFPTFARFRPSARTGGLVVEREARVLGPLPRVGAPPDGSPRDSATLALAPRFWGGMYVRVFGLTLPLPRLAPPRARDLVVMYLATDALVIADRRAAQGSTGSPTATRSPCSPSPRPGASRRPCASRQGRRLPRGRGQRPPAPREAAAAETAGALVGDVDWTRDDGMDVDDAVMQKFLESSDKFKSQFSVQDMLDGKIRAEDPLGDLLARDDRGRARGGNDAL
ncbi:hypothetical protein SO694_00006450 [Aureococcus anophagefferens]|uniref:Plastid lipid-associated protein/fibrillin conserved domain-containing protein n=1 Tax=Aureococcus anophagefferens TaxID=44056 RepID=A0ABR1GAK8_AURAN